MGRLPAKSGGLPGSRPNFHAVYEPISLDYIGDADMILVGIDTIVRSLLSNRFGIVKRLMQHFCYLCKKRCHQYVYSTELTVSFEHTERSLNFDPFNISQVLSDASWQSNPRISSQESR